MNTLALREMDFHSELANRDRLIAEAFYVNLHTRALFVVDDAMTKGSQLKICVEFAVDARELIQVECGCDAERVVVSRF